jgi:zinc protease
LFELFVSAREGQSAEKLLEVIDTEFAKVQSEPVSAEEITRAAARLELGLLAGLETVDGKASTLGFYEIVLGRPGAAFERLETTRRVTASDLLRVARRYLLPRYRSVILVRPDPNASSSDETDDSDDDAEAAQ